MCFFSRHACALIKNPLQRYYFFLIHANNSEDFCDFTPKIFVILLRGFLQFYSDCFYFASAKVRKICDVCKKKRNKNRKSLSKFAYMQKKQ